MAIRTPRLYRKPSGVYWVRILLPAGSEQTDKSILELRRSLRTRDWKEAHTIGSILNAVLARTRKSEWSTVVNDFFNQQQLSGWTLPGGISVSGDDDQRRLEAFLRDHPDVRAGVVAFLRNASVMVAGGGAITMPVPMAPHAGSPILSATPLLSAPTQADVKSPMRMSVAIEKFPERASDEHRRARTGTDQLRAVRNLVQFVVAEHPHLGPDPWVHDIGTEMITAFIDAEKKRVGKYLDDEGKPQPVTASTIRKRLLDLRVFFRTAHEEDNACASNPVDGLERRISSLSRKAGREKQSYLPFTATQITRIFQPEAYLSRLNTPDLFWIPLLAAHQGGRLGEYVKLNVDDVGRNLNGTWFTQVREETGKNENSVRLIPLPQVLIDLGFLNYVQHVKDLGGHSLWPQLNLDTPTARAKPGKSQTEDFSLYLKHVGAKTPRHVFHSFRHTVVTALIDARTPLHISMQICGHEAQEASVKAGLISESAANSVHIKVYGHADVERLSADSPLDTMKETLDSALRLPIDYAALKVAAAIVMRHVKKVGGKFQAGWPLQNKGYTARQVERLKAKKTSVASGISNV